MKKITDKERLDWLTRTTVPYPIRSKNQPDTNGKWEAWGTGDFCKAKSPRAAIDAAIRASKRGKKP
jgi:hypothetical protein